MSCTISTRLELVALLGHQYVVLLIRQHMDIWQLDAALFNAPSRVVPCTAGSPTDSSCGLGAALRFR